jgi:DnaJ-class molecular chaperone
MDFDPNKDYYKILGVAEDASIDDIKKAFKKAAVKHHPDK